MENELVSRYCFCCEEQYWVNEDETVCPNCGSEQFYGDEDDYDDDGQPDEFTEWQDVYGGDVSEYGTYGCYPGADDF